MDFKAGVPLEEALCIAGTGIYSYMVMISSGLVELAAICGIQLMSVVIPAAGCDLHLTTYQKGALNSMVYTGMIFTSHLWGFMADRFGRRTVLRICSLSSILVAFICSLVPDSLTLMVCSFILGALLAGIFTPVYVYIGECVPREVRPKAILICCAVSSLASAYLPAVAWVVIPLEINIPVLNTGIVFTSWRLYIALLMVPLFLSSALLYLLPETPKFLLSEGRHEETMNVLRKLYAKNKGAKEEDFPVLSVSLDSSDVMPEQLEKKSSSIFDFVYIVIKQTKMIFSPPYIKYSVLACILNAALIGMYSTIQLWFPETINKLVDYSSSYGWDEVQLCDVMGRPDLDPLFGDDLCKVKDDAFLINLVNGLFQSACYYLFSLIAPSFSAKKLVVGLSALATLCSATVIFVNHIIPLIMALAGIAIFLVVIIPVFITITVDFFPTSIRTNATSLILLTGRISSVLGSHALGALYSSRCELAYPAITSVLAGMTVLFITMPTSRKL